MRRSVEEGGEVELLHKDTGLGEDVDRGNNERRRRRGALDAV